MAVPSPVALPVADPQANAGFDPDAYLKEVTQPAAAAPEAAFNPDSYMDDELKKYVDDDNFDPLTLASEQPDKLPLAKEIEWRKSQRPMTGARAGQVAKSLVKSVPGIIRDFGAGAGAIGADAYVQATDDSPANVERAKTQQLARAQLIEQHGGSFMGKLLGPDSWLGKHIFTPERDAKSTADYKRAELDRTAPPGPAKDAALAKIDAEEKEALATLAAKPVENDRQTSDRLFDQKLAELQRSRELLKGNIQPDGMIADALKGVGNITRTLATGEPVNDDKSAVTNIFKSGDQLAAMGAPVDPEAIRTGAVTADPVNLLPLHVPGMTKVASKIGGGLLKAPAAIAGKVAENTPEVVSNILKKKLLGTAAVAGGGALTAEAMRDPAGAAKMLAAAGIATAGLAGARYFGRVMDTAGSKLLDPTFVSAAERAGAESAMNIEKAGGGQLSKFFDPAMNKADFERAIVKPIQSGVTAPIAMAPLNAALSDNPEEFGALSGTAMGFGAFSGMTAYNPLKGFHPETVAAVDSILRDNGAKKKYGTPLDAQHDAFMAKAPEGVRDAVNSYRGFFDGFKMPNGREPQIYVLPSAEFGAEVAKRRPDITPEHAAKQRGFAGKDGAILVNGDYGGEAPGILGHEAGGHVAQSIMEVLAPEVAKSMDAAALKGLTDASGKPTPKLKAFVDAYNKEFDPTGKTKGIETTDHAIAEWLAEQGRAVLEGQGPAKFAAGTSLRQTIGDNLADHFHKVFGTKRMFDRSEVPALARQYRDLLFQLGRFRTQEGPQAAPPEAAPAPGAPPAAPGAPAGAAPAVAPAVPVAVDRATVSAALRSLFGVKQAEADAMAAAASGNTVEEMIASAAQAKSKANAGSSTTAPAAQPAGQLAGVAAVAEPAGAPAAPAAQLAGFGESAPAPKAKIFVRRLPDGTFVDRQGNPVDPRTGLAPEAPNLDRGGAATPPEAPARPVATPEDITGRVQAAEDAARAAEAGKKRKTPESREKATAQAVKEARIQALLDAAHEAAPDESHLQRREEFGTVKFTGRIDESIPAHRMLLDELGVSEGGRANIETLSANLGKPVFIQYKSAAKEGSSEAAQASGQVDRTGKQRAKEYKAESVDSRIEDAQAGDVNTGVEQTKSFYPLGFRVNPSTGSVTVTGFSPQRLLANVGKIVEFMRGKGRDTGYSGPDDPAIHDDMQGYAQNHANGYKGDGSGPIEGETPNSHYEPHVIDSTRFDLLNAAMGNESAKTPKSDREGAKARAGDLQDFAAANDTLVTPEGETNPLRQWLNDSGFEFKNEAGETRTGTKEVLEPTIESLRVDPELMRDISTEAPEGESSLRPTGVADPSGMTAAGIPKARNVAAGFMPGHGPENGQLSNFGGEQDKPSIKSKVPQTDELGFYSRLRQHVDEADFGRSKAKTAQHWLGVIEKWAKGASTPTLGVQSRGIARDELEWSGVKEWLKSQGSKPIKKADVLAFIDGNGVKVSEVQKGGGDSKGSAYYMDHEFEDHSYAFDDSEGAWLLDASPNSDFFGEDEADRMDRKPLIAIFKPKSDIAKNSDVYGDHEAPPEQRYVAEVDGEEVGRFGNVREAEKFLAEAVKKHEEEHGQHTQYEVWDAESNQPIRGESYDTLEEAKARGMELAAEALRSINEQHSLEGGGDGGTQFSGYKLEGGSNYKEILLTLPEGEAASDADNFTESHWDEPNVVAHFRQQDFEGNIRTVTEDGKGYTNPAPEKVRHIDEIQSDWHQKGRERGYKGDKASPEEDALRKQLEDIEKRRTEFLKENGFKSGGDLNLELRKLRDAYDEEHNSGAVSGSEVMDALGIPESKQHDYWKKLDEDGRRQLFDAHREEHMPKPEELKRLESLADQHGDFRQEQSDVQDKLKPFEAVRKVPDAPFKKTWAQLAFKRALKLAIEDGMDRLSWSTGDQNIEHYKDALTAEVQRITWTHPPGSDSKVVTLDARRSGWMKFNVKPDGTIYDSGGARVASQFEGKSLAEVIGKENAEKILAPGEGSMNGDGMEVGGSGMRTFYDEMIPQFARQYVAKWNSKVEDAVLPTGDTVHSVKITPEMKAAVDRGQPMFMPGSRGAEQAAGGKKQLEDFGKPDKFGFYSGLARTIDAKVPSKASGEQILNTLKGAGAKAEELEYTGLPEFLKSHDGPVTKQELQEFVKAGGVQFKEVVKRKVDWPMEKSKRLAELDQKERRGPLTEAEGEEYVRLMEEERDWQDSGPAPRYDGYQVPGGKNYKEILLTLPTAKVKSDAFMRETLDPESLAIYENQDDPSSTFRTNHWDEPNVLAHIRQADHTDAEGNKVRLIEEIQSDWHQKGRKEGYQGDNAKKMKALGVRERELSDRLVELRRKGQLSPEEITEHDSLADESRKLSEQIYALNQQGGVSGVPDAPFKKSWAELAFKRALRLAAEDGMDKIAWTPGEEQARRYKEALVREVSGIEWDELQNTETVDGKLKITPSGQKAVTIKTPSGGDVKLVADSTGKIIRSTDRSGFGQQFVGKGLDDVIGKDNAEKIMGDKHGDLDAEGMSVGGDGMKGFYDKILPDFVRKYVRKWGGKVENGEVSTAAKYQFSPVRAKDGYGKQIKLEDGSDAYVLQDIASGDYLADKAQNTRAGRPQDGQLFSKVDADAIADKKVADFSQNVWSVDITPQMREAVMQEGQPMFMPGKGPEKPAGDLSDFGDNNESSIESKVEWAQPKRAKAAGDVVVNVKTSAFDEAFQKDHGFYIDKDGNGEIKGRRDRFKEFLKEGKAIEMPEVVITKEGTAAFVNGRHRFSVMRDAGVESVPMSMDETSALRAQTLGMTVEAKSKGGDLGSFMPSDETGRGEFDVKEKKPVDERRARLMADMQGQAKWLTDRAKEKGFDSVDDLMAEDFEGYNELAKQWREEHPRFNAAGEQLFMPGKMEGATPEEREANFSKWTGDAPVIRVGDSLHDVEPGQPVVIEGFHGTTHDFTAVDTSKANIENDWGKGFYVTNTPEDVENNYAGEGPDLTQRIEKRAERVEQELEDMEPEDISRVFGITPEQAQAIVDGEGKGYGTPEYKSRQEALKVIAKKELTTHGGSTMKVFVKLENPLKLGEGSGKEDYWDAETPMDEETGDPDGEPTGKLVDFIKALREVSSDYDEADIDSADDLNQLIWDGGTTPSKALAAAKEALQYATDPETGDLAASEILRAAVERMGYDGIIDETVNDKFGSNKSTGKAMAGMDDYTFHVIAFRPESVKSATGNRGTFDGSNPDMTMMPGNSARRTWFMRNGKRVYHHRGEAGQFAEKPALAKLGASAISQKKDDNAKAQLETFK